MLGVNNISNTGELTMDSITQKAYQRATLSDEPENSVKNFTSTRQLMNALGYAIWELLRNTAPIHR